MNSAGNALGQGNRANATIGRALQLVVRNVGGGRPQEEDRAAHGQPGKLSSCFAERLHDSPWPGLAQDRGVPTSETGVTLFAGEAPRLIIDQLARTPEQLCAQPRRGARVGRAPTPAPGVRRAARRRARARPDLPRAGWDRARVRRSCSSGRRAPPESSRAAPTGSPRGSRRGSSATRRADPEVRRARPDPARPRRRRRGPVQHDLRRLGRRRDRIGTRDQERRAVAVTILDPTREAEPRRVARWPTERLRRRRAGDDRAARHQQAARRRVPRRARAAARGARATRSSARPSRRSPSRRRPTSAPRSRAAATR